MFPLCGQDADNWLVMNFTLLGVHQNVVSGITFDFCG
jgi:hypothetical protein